MAVVGRRRMARPLLLGLLLWGVPILVTGSCAAIGVAIAAMAVLGAGNAVLDISGFTLLQRTVPNASRGSVFGVLEALVMLNVGLGAVLGPLLVELLSLRGAWITTGCLLPALALLTLRALSSADDHAVIPEEELGLLRGVPMLQVLPLTVLEQVAADCRRCPSRPARRSSSRRRGRPLLRDRLGRGGGTGRPSRRAPPGAG